MTNAYGDDAHLGDGPDFGFGSYLGVNNFRGILEFDLSTVPAEFEFTSATLTLFQDESYGAHHQYRAHIYRITEAWDEAEVSWVHRTATELWSTPGGAYGEEWATVEFTAAMGYEPVHFDITGLVHAWLDGTYPNYGLALVPETLYISPGGSPTNNYTMFVLSDHPSAPPQYRPMLTIPEPATLALVGLGALTLLRRWR